MIKYPRTVHLPFSPGATNGDKITKFATSLGQDLVHDVELQKLLV